MLQTRPSPFKGEDRWGMGDCTGYPHPHPDPPLEGEGEFTDVIIYIFSKMPAAPMPPPMHMETQP
jgi:hypothetical protein